MKLTASPSQHTLRIEPGDTLEIVFDPAGVNAPVGGHNLRLAVTVGSIRLPDGGLALSLDVQNELAYKSPSHHLVLCRDFGASRLEFDTQPRLVLEKIDCVWSEVASDPPFRKGWTDCTGKVHLDSG